MARQTERQKPAFDRFMEKYPLHFLERMLKISFYPSPARLGITSILSTVFLSFIAIAIALYAVYEAKDGGGVMLGFIIAIGVIGVVGMLAIGIMNVYFLRNQNEPDVEVFLRGIMKGASENEVERFGIRVGKYAKEVMDEKESSPRRRAKAKKDSKA